VKPWHLLFDIVFKGLSSVTVWIKLPNLPLEYWIDKGFRAIGNTLGSFIAENSSYKSFLDRVMAQIFVELDPSEGLYESIKLVVGNQNYVQLLDYLNLPFWCVRFHCVVHVVVDCDKGPIKKIPKVDWVEPSRFNKVEKGRALARDVGLGGGSSPSSNTG
jgi:hypothetical protein